MTFRYTVMIPATSTVARSLTVTAPDRPSTVQPQEFDDGEVGAPVGMGDVVH